MLKEIVTDFLEKYNLGDKTIVVGFSGGYDSMCLVHILSEIKNLPEFDKLNIITAHFNHNWRGEEALREQEVCRLFSASAGFEFFTKTAPAGLKKNENDARIARYEFFEEACENYEADAVFTAHNRDDNAETRLLDPPKNLLILPPCVIAYTSVLTLSLYAFIHCFRVLISASISASDLSTASPFIFRTFSCTAALKPVTRLIDS